MKKINILQKSDDFERIIKNNKSYKYKDYIIYIEKNNDEIYHFEVDISRKKNKGNYAVIRNKVKRQLKSIIDKKNYQKGFNCIIIVSKGILNRNYEEMEINLNYAFKKLNIIEGEN